MNKELEMIKQLMDDYIEEANKPKASYTWPVKGELNKSKLKRIRLMVQDKMLELERGNS